MSELYPSHWVETKIDDITTNVEKREPEQDENLFPVSGSFRASQETDDWELEDVDLLDPSQG